VGYMIERASQLELDIDFITGPTGFQPSHGWIFEPTSNEARWIVYLGAVLNTLRLALVGIVLATIVGVVAGVARLSDNWLVSKIALVYVETFRNTPVLVQIIFWYTAVFLKLPEISRELNLFETFYLSNRALQLPWPEPRNELFAVWMLVLAVALTAGIFVRRRRVQQENQTGQTRRPNLFGLATFLVIATISYVALLFPVGIDVPEIQARAFTRQYEGGLGITPEFAALLIALVLYTGSFIAEIVRGSIQALPRGQSEAAMAVGLTGYQRTTLIILPQALRSMIPSLTNEYLNLTKNTSLAAVIAYADLFQVSTVIINKIGHAVVVYMIIILTYQVMSWTISGVMNYINRRVQLVGA
jgi:general L-amino acid transport system permease protein